MILTGPQIAHEHALGRLVLDPFDEEQVQPNSYNLALGPTLIHYTGTVLDTRQENAFETMVIPDEGLVLSPDRIYLGASVEVLGSDHYVPIIRSRSGAARLGMFVHVTADLIDIGSKGQTTFQLHAVQPVRVHAGDRLAQVTFWRTRGKVVLYTGKYQGSQGPQPSRIHRDALRERA
ncbi:dCTP deaminase [Streptomyces sp. AV19]|uniref:dCTP deaminase n=1 Tax=Streptomyces sp. AV19 TaxID=2793068 RepID=UPI0018FEF330|nr:dCTP deaminase [Streptomyces sp. AV19]MBH1933283.1 dCTP deaminase [Streptomyces sp. AV19]MDG4536174.1 dCTP deaminase [Streptomyces sp. AV19]